MVTGFLPGLLLSVWQLLVMPRLVHLLAQAEGQCNSLSDLDKRIGGIYWWWDIFNAFLGTPITSGLHSRVLLRVWSCWAAYIFPELVRFLMLENRFMTDAVFSNVVNSIVCHRTWCEDVDKL